MNQTANPLLTVNRCFCEVTPPPGAYLEKTPESSAAPLPLPLFTRSVLGIGAARLGSPHPPRYFFRNRLREGSVRSLVISLVMLGIGCMASAAEPVALSLRGRAVVRDGRVTLGAIADLNGADENLVSKMAAVEVGRLQPGGARTISRGELSTLLAASGFSSADVNVSGAAVVNVTAERQIPAPAQLIPVLIAHIHQVSRSKVDDVEVRSFGNLDKIQLPQGALSFRIPPGASSSDYHNYLVPFEALVDGKTVRTFWTEADIRVRGHVVQAAKRLQYGTTLSSADVEELVAEFPGPRVEYIQSRREVVGKVLRRTLSPGDPLTRENLTIPFLVRSGELVCIRLERGGLHVTASARAEQDGRLGQFIRVRNIQFDRVLSAQVTGRGEVKIIE